MMRPRVTERLRIGKVRMAGPWRSALAGWSLLPSAIDRLSLIPNDLFTPDPSFTREVCEGLFGLGGRAVTIGRGSPFALAHADPHWLEELHGFSWLGHLRVDGSADAVGIARRLVADWIDRYRGGDGLAWRPVVLATRITSWLVNAALLLDEAEPAYYRSVLRSLGRQIRRLDAMRHDTAPGIDRAICAIALVKAALSIKAGARHVVRLEGELLAELGRQIGPSGGHISRNPADGLELLVHLLPLRGMYRAIGRDPQPLADLVDRMFRFLDHMRLGDGTLARFNGMGQNRNDKLGAVLALDRIQGPPSVDAIACGYARLRGGDSLVIVDVGRPPPLEYSAAAHAGCLSFEMSAGSGCIFRNCGAPGAGFRKDRQTARSTASHNTLALDARSSSHLVVSPALEELLGARPLRGPGEVTAAIHETETQVILDARHDGYVADTAVMHERRLALSRNGHRLEGIDRLGGRSGVLRLPVDLPFAIRFHLGPEVVVLAEQDGQSAMLEVDGFDLPWRFEVTGARLSIESSTDWAAVAGPSPGRQIVLRASCPGEVTVCWSLTAIEAAREERLDTPAPDNTPVSSPDGSC